jgi:hypothetical protein
MRPVSTDYSQSNGQNGIINDQNHNEVRPSKEQYERIARYHQEIKQLRVEKDAKSHEEEFLRSFMRQSERLRALENTSSNRSLAVKGVSNAGYSSMGEENVFQTSISQVTEALDRLKLTLPKSSLDALFNLEDLVQTPDFRIGQMCVKSSSQYGAILLLRPLSVVRRKSLQRTAFQFLMVAPRLGWSTNQQPRNLQQS